MTILRERPSCLLALSPVALTIIAPEPLLLLPLKELSSVVPLQSMRHAEEFQAPYSLKLEWMKPGDDNSGVFVGFPADPDPSDGDNTVNTSITEGEEIQIDSTDDPDSTTGAIYNEQAADAAARDAALKPDGEWNEYEIRVEADRTIVFLNGVKINEWVDDDPNVDLAQGYIGIQNHGVDDDVFFRNIRIKEAPANTHRWPRTTAPGPRPAGPSQSTCSPTTPTRRAIL
jgi:hypothetical protein